MKVIADNVIMSELENILREIGSKSVPAITVSSIVTADSPVKKLSRVSQGILVAANAIVWNLVLKEISTRPESIYEIPPLVWEEIIAAAFDKAGFDEVILTPRSGDHGRDVIAVRKGVGSIKIINSVKAYKKGHLVGQDDVRALLGVLTGERDASKGMITTTSDFAPRILKDPFIAPFVPTRLELMNGEALRAWLLALGESKGK